MLNNNFSMGIVSISMPRFCKSYLYTVVLYILYFHPMYLSSLKSLDKYIASLNHKISNLDLPSQTVNFMKCSEKIP